MLVLLLFFFWHSINIGCITTYCSASFLHFLNWSKVYLQCCVSFRHTERWLRCVCVYIYIYNMYIHIFQIFSIIGYYKILNTTLCAIQWGLVVYFIRSSMYPFIPNSLLLGFEVTGCSKKSLFKLSKGKTKVFLDAPSPCLKSCCRPGCWHAGTLSAVPVHHLMRWSVCLSFAVGCLFSKKPARGETNGST